MPEHRHHDPGSRWEEDGIPDLQEGTPEQYWAEDPQEAPVPGDKPTAVNRFGTTASEYQAGAPLDERLREEEPDVDRASRWRPDDDDDTPWPAPGEDAAGRLVEPDHGAEVDTEATAVADEYGADGGGFSAEERAVHITEEPR